MASKRDLRSNFAKSDNAKVKLNSQKYKQKASYLIISKTHYENILLKIKQEIGNYAAIHGSKQQLIAFQKFTQSFLSEV